MSSGSASMPRMIKKKKHFRVKHQKVKLFRANEPILSVFMWGINHTVNKIYILSIHHVILQQTKIFIFIFYIFWFIL